MSDDILSELIEPGVLRAGINLGNVLLVTGQADNGDPEGVSPDMAAGVAAALGVELKLCPYPSPGGVGDALGRGEIDLGNIAYEPKRAETIAFVDAYVEIEATYMVPADSPLTTIEDVDAEGVRIAVSERSAYDLYLSRTLKHAEIERGKGLPGALQLFVDAKLEALAGLRPALNENAADLGKMRVLDGRFSTVTQAIGTRPENKNLHAFLQHFVETAKADGTVQALIDKHGVTGKLQVAT